MNRYFKGLKGYKNWIKKVVHKEGMFDIDINLASALMSNQGSFNVLFKQLWFQIRWSSPCSQNNVQTNDSDSHEILMIRYWYGVFDM